MLAWARDATDFRPSINGVGGACASRRMVWESSRERWCDGAGCYRTFGFRPPLVVACMHVGVGARRDRFSTIDKRGRRCLREPAHGLGEWPRAMARRGRLLPDLSISAHTPQHVPDACSHRMQLSSLHPDEAPGQTVRRTSKAGFRRLHVHAEHVPHAMQCKHRTVRVHLEQRFSTLGIEGRGDPWRVGSEHGTSDERSRRLSDTLTAIPGAC
jgi:hypothetical protein